MVKLTRSDPAAPARKNVSLPTPNLQNDVMHVRFGTQGYEVSWAALRAVPKPEAALHDANTM